MSEYSESAIFVILFRNSVCQFEILARMIVHTNDSRRAYSYFFSNRALSRNLGKESPAVNRQKLRI